LEITETLVQSQTWLTWPLAEGHFGWRRLGFGCDLLTAYAQCDRITGALALRVDSQAALHPAVEAHAPSAHAHIPEGGAVDRTATVAIEGQEAVVRLVVAGSVRLAARMQRVQLAVRRNGELRVLGHLQVAVAAPAI